MAINFPDAPTLNQIHTAAGCSWKWDSTKWVVSGASPPSMIVVNSTTTLTTGFTGYVRVENTTSAPMTVTLPASPTAAQEITIKDSSGNAGTYAIVVSAAAIEGGTSLTINTNWGWVDLVYTGTRWVQC